MLTTVASLAVIAINLLAANTATAADCDHNIHTMLAAQGTRAIKELRLCLMRNPDGTACAFKKSPTMDVREDYHLEAAEPQLNSRLRRVERHAENKFPRKCSTESASYFMPICAEATQSYFSSKEDLTECLYIEHVMGWGQNLYAVLHPGAPSPGEELGDEPPTGPVPGALRVSSACEGEMIKQMRLGWRDIIRKNLDRFPSRRKRRLRRHCSDSPDANHAWGALVDVTTASAIPLRDFRRIDK